MLKLTENVPQGLEKFVGDLDAGLVVVAVPQHFGAQEGDQFVHHLVLSTLFVNEIVAYVKDVRGGHLKKKYKDEEIEISSAGPRRRSRIEKKETTYEGAGQGRVVPFM